MNAVLAYSVVELGIYQLWVSALIAGLVCGGLWLRGRIARVASPVSTESRYWLWYSALIVMAALPLGMLIPKSLVPRWEVAPLNQMRLMEHADRGLNGVTAGDAGARVARLLAPDPPRRPSWIREAAAPVATSIIVFWAAIAMWRLMRVYRGLATLRRWKRSASVVPSLLMQSCDVRESAHVSTPMVVGILDPCVLLPTGLREKLTPEQLEHVLAHEREHIRRRDPLCALVQRIIQAIYFHNPAIHWVARVIDHERECSCDDRVLAHGRDGHAYASSLLSVARLVVAVPAPAEAMNAVGHRLQLSQRIERLLSHRSGKGVRMSWFTVGSITSVVVAAAVLLAPSVPFAKGLERRAVMSPETDESAEARPDSRALVEALVRGDEDAADELLRAGTDINTPVRGDGSPLIIAARSGNKSMVRRLLASGADVNLASRGDGTPLINAAARGDLYIVRELVERGADVNGYVSGDGNPLIAASSRGKLDVAKFLIDHGADVNANVPGDETPLINASAQGQAEAVKYLVSRGANVNLAVHRDDVPEGELRSPLSEARKYGHDDVVKLLESLGAR